MKTKVGIIFLSIITGLALFGCSTTPPPTPTPAASSPARSVKTVSRVVASAKVVPAQNADLSLPVGGTVAKILVAEGQRVAAGQVLVQTDSSGSNGSVALAEAKLASAEAHFAEVTAGARPQEISSAEATLAVAKANLQKVKQGPSDDKIVTARVDLANAEATLRQAQTAYDLISWRSDIQASPEALQLQKTTNDYTGAQGRLENLQKGPTAADVAAAQAEVQKAQAQLDLVKAGARPETLAASRAEVDAAKAVLDQAKAALNEGQLKAPFAGTVMSLNIHTGEFAAPGAVVLRLADTANWQIETTDLTELSIVNVSEDTPATVTIDAIPGLELPGKVRTVKAYGDNRQGDIVYTVVVGLDQQEPRLRWNMTAKVTIEPK